MIDNRFSKVCVLLRQIAEAYAMQYALIAATSCLDYSCSTASIYTGTMYAACNSIFSHSHGVNEMALLALQEAYSLSVLL